VFGVLVKIFTNSTLSIGAVLKKNKKDKTKFKLFFSWLVDTKR